MSQNISTKCKTTHAVNKLNNGHTIVITHSKGILLHIYNKNNA